MLLSRRESSVGHTAPTTGVREVGFVLPSTRHVVGRLATLASSFLLPGPVPEPHPDTRSTSAWAYASGDPARLSMQCGRRGTHHMLRPTQLGRSLHTEGASPTRRHVSATHCQRLPLPRRHWNVRGRTVHGGDRERALRFGCGYSSPYPIPVVHSRFGPSGVPAPPGRLGFDGRGGV